MDWTQAVGYKWAMRWLNRAIERAKAMDLQEGDLADMASTGGKTVDPSRISKWKRGEGRPYLDQVMGIAEGLGVSLDYLLADDMPWLDDAAKTGVGPEVSRETYAVMKVVRAMGLSTEEAIRRLATRTSAPPQGEMVFVAERRLAGAGGDPAGAESTDPPVGPRRRVKGRG